MRLAQQVACMQNVATGAWPILQAAIGLYSKCGFKDVTEQLAPSMDGPTQLKLGELPHCRCRLPQARRRDDSRCHALACRSSQITQGQAATLVPDLTAYKLHSSLT